MAGAVSQWSDSSGKYVYAATGSYQVLFIVSEDDSDHPDAVRRRPAMDLTEEVRGKLENQGISVDQQLDDLSILKARYSLDETPCAGTEVSPPGGPALTREGVLRRIATLMAANRDSGGVILHYIGDGRRNTGDWCFRDGFITFADLAELYMQHLRGRILWIVSDCSHSGSWVRDCMTFLDQQGVGPCGHKAREKGILLKFHGSCVSYQVPRQLAHSLYGCHNDKNTGCLVYTSYYISQDGKVADNQHTCGMNFTELRCGHKSIEDECLCFEGLATWHRWQIVNRIRTLIFKSMKMWMILLLPDDDKMAIKYHETVAAGSTDCIQHDMVLLAGDGEEPTKEERRSVVDPYNVYREKLC